MFGPIGFPELMLIMIVALLVFGPQKLPEFAKTLGKFIREFKSTVDDAKSTIEREIEQADIRKDLNDFDRELKKDFDLDLDRSDYKPEISGAESYAHVPPDEPANDAKTGTDADQAPASDDPQKSTQPPPSDDEKESR